MTFYVNDIIEVLNLTPYQEWLVGQMDSKRVIGMRFKINAKFKMPDNSESFTVTTQTTRGIIGDKNVDVNFSGDQITLYKRPLINKVINLLNHISL